MKLKNRMRLFGSIFMLISILLGAFASHYLERFLTSESLSSFQVGIRYLTYHGLALLLFSSFDFFTDREKKIFSTLIILGSILFSGSIFILSFKSQFSFSLAWIGPVTPLGGTALIIAWILTTREFMKKPF